MSNEEKKNIKLFIGVGICIGLLLAILVNIIRVKTITYEYFKDNKFGKSNQCYVDEKENCMCLIGNQFVVVDQFYYVN